MRIAFRVDASIDIGTGHVIRCLALAEALRARGGETFFVCKPSAGNLIHVIEERGLVVKLIPDSPLSEAEDAQVTICHVEEVDWVIVDHYSLGEEWESALRSFGARVLAIEDLDDRLHTADVLIDSTYPGNHERYKSRTSAHLLLGPRYALLAPAYQSLSRDRGDRSSANPSVLVHFGGTDVHNASGLTLRALEHHEFSISSVVVVVGDSNPHKEDVKQLISRNAGWRDTGPQQNLAELMHAADVMVSGGGVTLLERLCMGVPGVAITLAKNQVPSTLALADAGLTAFAGDIADITEASLVKDVGALIADARGRARMAEAGRVVVDGLGALRVAEFLIPTIPESMTMRFADETDVGTYFAWANDDAVRRQAIQSKPIPWSSHREWFTTRLNSSATFMFVLEADGLPLAQARFDIDGCRLMLDYSVDACFRGRGLGQLVVQRALELMPIDTPSEVIAIVKRTNTASMSALLSVGFIRSDEGGSETGLVELRLQRTEN